jgi:AraC-like DNA-binding protein
VAEPTAAAGVLRGIVRAAVARGADREALLDAAGIGPADLDEHDRRLPLDRYRALIGSAKRLLGDPAFALHYGETVDLSEVSVVGLIGLASETMVEAFRQLQRYARLMVDVDTGGRERFELVRRGDDLWLVDNRLNAADFPEQTEIAFAQMVAGCRAFGVDPFALEVRLSHPDPGYRDEYERVLRAPVTFQAGENSMRLEQLFLHHPIAVQPRYVFGILSEHAEGLLKQLQDRQTARGRVEALLMPRLHTGDIGIERIAAAMGVSRQTLYRRLRQEGVTFGRLLDALRHRLALDYLGAGKVSINEVAYLVGFSDPAAFSRAFKRWTGSSPSAMRRRKS